MTKAHNEIEVKLDSVIKFSDGYKIQAISAGQGNGYTFTKEVLKASLSLWENVPSFVDHSWFGSSLRDMCAVFSNVEFSEEAGAIQGELTPFGPAKDVLVAFADDIKNTGKSPDVGFSAVLALQVKEKGIVENILRIRSLDLVFSPARGGKFLSTEGVEPMTVKNEEEVTMSNEDILKQSTLVCEALLSSSLNSSELPDKMKDKIRKDFAGKLFRAEDLETSIKDAQEIVKELSAETTVQGPSRISGMFSTEDQLQVAVDNLLGAPIDADKKSLKVARLSGIKELYLMLTGDRELIGGYHDEYVKLATTADFTGLVKNALNKIIANRWGELGRAGYSWWERIVRIEQMSSLNTITGILVGTVGTLPSIAEGAEYTELVVGDSPETADFTKYGGYVPLTLELIDRDETRKLAAYPNELASAGLRKISALVAAIFTANSGVGPTMADTGALFNATAVTTAGGHANLLTAALAEASLEAAKTAIYDQPMLIKQATGYYGTGPKMAVNGKFVLVPRALELTAKKLVYPSLQNASQIYSENQQQGQPGDVITVPEWTDATDWACVADPVIVPGIFVYHRFGIMPEIFIAGDQLSPAVFMNDETRLKVRQFLSVSVNDFRPLHKSNVA